MASVAVAHAKYRRGKRKGVYELENIARKVVPARLIAEHGLVDNARSTLVRGIGSPDGPEADVETLELGMEVVEVSFIQLLIAR